MECNSSEDYRQYSEHNQCNSDSKYTEIMGKAIEGLYY
jgi:hypothetical protein